MLQLRQKRQLGPQLAEATTSIHTEKPYVIQSSTKEFGVTIHEGKFDYITAGGDNESGAEVGEGDSKLYRRDYGEIVTLINSVVLITASLLACLDFLIGKDGRKKIQLWFERLWIRLEDEGYESLIASLLLSLNRRTKKLFGQSISSKRIIVVVLVGSVTSIVLFGLGFSLLSLGGEPFFGTMVEMIKALFQDPISLLKFLFIGWVGNSLAIEMNLRLLSYLSSKPTWARINVVLLTSFAGAILLYTLSRICYWDLLGFTIDESKTGTWIVIAILLNVAVKYAVAIVSVTPIVLTFLMILGCIIVALLKAVKPLVEGPLNLLVYRFAESDKGVLTLLGIFLAGIVKVMEQIIRLF